ncbi:MAG: hypothetical protein IPN52_00665 [Micrococcales bacterium]|nr:hypothetical protein [Micrococcales bacterium]
MVGTCELAVDVRVWLAGQAVEYATTHTRGQVRAWLARRIARIDPEAADRKHRARVKKRCVRLWADPDGMATISAYLSARGPSGVGIVARPRPRSTRRGMLPTRMRLWG